ncbi:MAG TPA: hypothetical protein VKP58_14810 [Candidatus Acidoferrum sp.]|nr:hypothetical protein [Candidatus Acidoferrum sp.]
MAILMALLFVLGSIYFRYRYPLTAKIWHWRHGYSTTMGNYEVPVPEHWLIADQDLVALTLMNSSPNRPRDAKVHMTAVVTVFPFRQRAIGPDALAFWLSNERQWLARDGVESIHEKTLKIGDESITCIGGRQLDAILRRNSNHLETNFISFDCMSERGLNILFVGEQSDLQSFYNLVSQIRRKT